MLRHRQAVLGLLAGSLVVQSAYAADLPLKAKAVEYVRVCNLYGAGFWYIPGTDTCIKIGGYLRVDTTINGGGSHGQPAWSVAGTARGDLNSLSLTAHALSPFRADFTGRALELTSHWHVTGEANVENFDLRAWGISGPLGVTKARLAVTWNDAGFTGRGKVDPTGLHAGAFDAEFDGSFADRVLTAKHMEARHPSGAHAVGSGTFAIVPNGPRLDLKGSWENFRWPLLGPAPVVTSAAGTFSASAWSDSPK